MEGKADERARYYAGVVKDCLNSLVCNLSQSCKKIVPAPTMSSIYVLISIVQCLPSIDSLFVYLMYL